MNQLLIEKIDAILPQTQCKKCGFAGCRPYAEAIVEGGADINQCPPGGQQGIQKIAELLGIPTKPLNTMHGFPGSLQVVAWIDENLCIGCTFCIQSCPVDAIIGAAKQMHTVIADECTGCDLCVTPCPMDCISMIPVDKKAADLANSSVDAVKKQAADKARLRYQFRQQRIAHERQADHKARTQELIQPPQAQTSSEVRKQAIISAALKRAAAIRARTENKPDFIKNK
ncbi:electron transport complex subunit RsxB [Nitrosomonas ureae]|uniref:Electron transport complex protein RnfB n=1 Tax=Nitrosomonas ureae TaxID=44577 RepID=A0A1H5SI19_9PROT|nr:electron transport complex subunit RsxB [Nitrosomonas ureae]SEF50249.1 electron transport complex protein RnfB [Nitrosomonas ureae]